MLTDNWRQRLALHAINVAYLAFKLIVAFIYWALDR